MMHLLALCLLCFSALAQYPSEPHYSFHSAGSALTGSPFATSGLGRITAVRVWELQSSYIAGFQLSYDNIWTPRVGRNASNMVEMSLFEGEALIQVSGKYDPRNYIYQICFSTSRGRSLTAGQPSGLAFFHSASYADGELLLLSGRVNRNGITSLGSHWGPIDPSTSPPMNNNSTSLAPN